MEWGGGVRLPDGFSCCAELGKPSESALEGFKRRQFQGRCCRCERVGHWHIKSGTRCRIG